MHRNFALLIFCGISLLTFGCGSSQKINSAKNEPDYKVGRLDNGLSQVVREINSQIGPNKNPVIAVFDLSFPGSEDLPLVRYINTELTTLLVSGGRFRVFGRDDIDKALEELRINRADIFGNPKARKEFGKFLKVDALVGGEIQELSEQIRVNVRLMDLDNLLNLAAANTSVAKDKDVLRLLKQPIPGRLNVAATTGEGVIEVNGRSKGAVNQQGLSLKLPPGYYSIKVSKPDFVTLEKSIVIREDEMQTLKVQFVDDGGSKVLSSFLLGAILPGSAALGRNGTGSAYSLNGTSALLFYISGTLFLADQLKKHTFLTKNSEDQYNKIKNLEMYAMLGSYAVNLVTSVIIGIDQSSRSRRVEEVALSERSSVPLFSLSPFSGSPPAMGIYLNCSIPVN